MTKNNFLKKNWSNILFIIFISLLLIPQTRLPVVVFLQRAISFSPSQIAESKREKLENYNWQLQSLEGKELNFNQSKNKVVLINYWATWCPPCVAEMPELQNLYKAYGDQVDFYFITADAPKKVIKFLEKNRFTLPVFYEITAAPIKLQTESLPTTFLISKNGELIIKKIGAAKWNSDKVHKLLNELLSK